MRLRGLIVLIALCAALAAPAGAPAAHSQLVPCGLYGLECTTVTVPIDRSGATPGTVSLHVEELPAPGKPRGVLFFVAGGPGQGSAGTFQLGANAIDWRDQFPGYTLVAFDNRGTGKSGVLRCPELQADPFASGARAQALTAKCATEIGATRAFYSTRDHADDIDAVRQALGRDKIALWGTSYGTQLSVAYALTYPSHVDRLVLDSVADAAGRDPFSLDDLQQMPKGLAPVSQRAALLAAARNALAPGATGPFGKWATDIGPAALCLLWPPQSRRPGVGSGPVPNVPVLVLAGERDLRTPASNAAAVAARFPQGHLLTAPGVGHSVLGADFTTCSGDA